MRSILLSALLIPSITFGMGYYQVSGDGSKEWVDTIRVVDTCVNSRGSVLHRNPDGTCESSPDYMYSDPQMRIIGEYYSDIGRAAVINAQNSKFPDSVSSSLEQTNLNNASNSASGASSGSNSTSGAVSNSSAQSQSQADARAKAIQQQLQVQEQNFNRHRK